MSAAAWNRAAAADYEQRELLLGFAAGPPLEPIMPTLEEVHAFLARHYKHDRFEGRDGAVWGANYSRNIAADRLADLEAYGEAFVSRHESANGQAFRFGPTLEAAP